MKTNRLFALVLVIALVLGMSISATAEDKYLEGHSAIVITEPANYEGKTVILHSNDVHGAVDGYAAMAALRKEYEAKGAEVIVVDAGDFSQGTTYVSMSEGHSAIDLMNAAGYDLANLGNHEFDFGYDRLMANIADATFPVLCANVFSDETGETILPATHVIETASGLKLGFFGIETPETATKVNPGLIKGITFSTFGKLYESAQSAIDSLEGSDLIIGLVHLGMDQESATNGYRSVDLLNNVTGVDFLIDAHSHTVMTNGSNDEPIQSTGTKFNYIGVVVIDNESKEIETHYLKSTVPIEKDEEVDALAQEIITAVDDKFGAVFATTEVLLNGERAPGVRTEETNLGDLIADALVWTATKDGGIDYDKIKGVVGVTNGGGIRATINEGDITMNDVNTVLPFGNTVTVVYVTGNELLEALEASTFSTPEAIGAYPQTSGIEWTLDATVPYEQGEIYTLDGKESSYYAPAAIKRVSIASVGGEAFDPEAVYAVVTNDFCAAGGDTYNVFNRAYAASEGFDTGIPMDEAVVNYITEVLSGVITADAYGEPAGAQTQILPEAPAA